MEKEHSLPSILPLSRRAIVAVFIRHITLFSLALAPFAALLCATYIPLHRYLDSDSESEESEYSFSHCNIDGTFTAEEYPTVSLWLISSTFDITLFWGDLSFPTAKFIDIAWSIVVGHIGQAVLIWINFTVSTKVLTRIMEESQVSYETFQGLAFTPAALSNVITVARELLTNRGMWTRARVTFLMFSSLFVLAFPFFASSMSGYNTNMSAFLILPTGVPIPWDDLVQLSDDLWVYENLTYSLDYVQQHASCQPINSHNWGFSFILLFIYLLLLSIWSIGTYIMWIDTYLHSKLDRKGRKMGIMRASHDLVEAMHANGALERVNSSLGEGELKKKVVCTRQASMSYRPLIEPDYLTRWEEFKIWCGGARDTRSSSGKSSRQGSSLSSSLSASDDFVCSIPSEPKGDVHFQSFSIK